MNTSKKCYFCSSVLNIKQNKTTCLNCKTGCFKGCEIYLDITYNNKNYVVFWNIYTKVAWIWDRNSYIAILHFNNMNDITPSNALKKLSLVVFL